MPDRSSLQRNYRYLNEVIFGRPLAMKTQLPFRGPRQEISTHKVCMTATLPMELIAESKLDIKAARTPAMIRLRNKWGSCVATKAGSTWSECGIAAFNSGVLGVKSDESPSSRH